MQGSIFKTLTMGVIKWPYHLFHAKVHLLKFMEHYYATPIQFEAPRPNGANAPKCLLQATLNSP